MTMTNTTARTSAIDCHPARFADLIDAADRYRDDDEATRHDVLLRFLELNADHVLVGSFADRLCPERAAWDRAIRIIADMAAAARPIDFEARRLVGDWIAGEGTGADETRGEVAKRQAAGEWLLGLLDREEASAPHVRDVVDGPQFDRIAAALTVLHDELDDARQLHPESPEVADLVDRVRAVCDRVFVIGSE